MLKWCFSVIGMRNRERLILWLKQAQRPFQLLHLNKWVCLINKSSALCGAYHTVNLGILVFINQDKYTHRHVAVSSPYKHILNFKAEIQKVTIVSCYLPGLGRSGFKKAIHFFKCNNGFWIIVHASCMFVGVQTYKYSFLYTFFFCYTELENEIGTYSFIYKKNSDLSNHYKNG